MIETAGVDRNLVPATDRIYACLLTAWLMVAPWGGVEARTQSITMTAREALPPNHRAEAEDKSKHCSSRYPAVIACEHVESPSI
jgi:hypothetical protein